MSYPPRPQLMIRSRQLYRERYGASIIRPFDLGCRSASVRALAGRRLRASTSRRRSPTRPGSRILVAPYLSEKMTCWPVSARLGDLKNNDPSLVEPLDRAD